MCIRDRCNSVTYTHIYKFIYTNKSQIIIIVSLVLILISLRGSLISLISFTLNNDAMSVRNADFSVFCTFGSKLPAILHNGRSHNLLRIKYIKPCKSVCYNNSSESTMTTQVSNCDPNFFNEIRSPINDDAIVIN